MASAFVNLFAAIAALAAVAVLVRRHSFRNVMRYFTAQSNVFCAFSCLAVFAFRLLADDVPQAVLIWKFVGTAAVMVTFLTVVFFLIPQFGAKALFAGPDLWLHLVCPLLALLSYLFWDKPQMPFACTLLGAAPVLLYAVLYLRKVIFEKPEKRWEDFYGFNKGGHWPVSFLAMTAGAFLLSVLLWAV